MALDGANDLKQLKRRFEEFRGTRMTRGRLARQTALVKCP